MRNGEGVIALPPSRAGRGILEHDALSQQLGSDAVGLGEVARRLGCRARVDQGLYRRFVHSGTCAQEGLRVALQQAQATGQRLEQAGGFRRAGAVDLARQLEQHGDGLGRAEVFIHGGLEAGGEGPAPVDGGRLGRRHQAERGVEAAQRGAGVVQMRVAVVQGAAVVRTHDEEAHGFRVVLGQHVADGEEVAERLAHLLVVHAHEAVVDPELRQRLAGGAFALGDLVLVVRELQVGSAAVDVEALAQRGAAHGRAFDVPAGTSGAEGTVPLGLGRLLGLGGFPQHEVKRIVLALQHGHALAGAQLVQRLARKLAVARELAHRVVHVAAAALVGQALVLQPADQGQHLRHVFGGTRLDGRGLDAQPADVLVHGGDHLVGQLADGDAALDRAADDLVVDVGDVAHVGHAQTAAPEPALHHVEGHHHPGMADVAQVVDRHAAHVHAHMAGLDRGKVFQCTRQRVVDAQTHRECQSMSGNLQLPPRVERQAQSHRGTGCLGTEAAAPHPGGPAAATALRQRKPLSYNPPQYKPRYG